LLISILTTQGLKSITPRGESLGDTGRDPFPLVNDSAEIRGRPSSSSLTMSVPCPASGQIPASGIVSYLRKKKLFLPHNLIKILSLPCIWGQTTDLLGKSADYLGVTRRKCKFFSCPLDLAPMVSASPLFFRFFFAGLEHPDSVVPSATLRPLVPSPADHLDDLV